MMSDPNAVNIVDVHTHQLLARRCSCVFEVWYMFTKNDFYLVYYSYLTYHLYCTAPLFLLVYFFTCSGHCNLNIQCLFTTVKA